MSINPTEICTLGAVGGSVRVTTVGSSNLRAGWWSASGKLFINIAVNHTIHHAREIEHRLPPAHLHRVDRLPLLAVAAADLAAGLGPELVESATVELRHPRRTDRSQRERASSHRNGTDINDAGVRAVVC